MELSLLILVYIHKSYLVYLVVSRLLGNKCCADRSWIFIFWSWKSHGKSMLKKRGHPAMSGVNESIKPSQLHDWISPQNSHSASSSVNMYRGQIGACERLCNLINYLQCCVTWPANSLLQRSLWDLSTGCTLWASSSSTLLENWPVLNAQHYITMYWCKVGLRACSRL